MTQTAPSSESSQPVVKGPYRRFRHRTRRRPLLLLAIGVCVAMLATGGYLIWDRSPTTSRAGATPTVAASPSDGQAGPLGPSADPTTAAASPSTGLGASPTPARSNVAVLPGSWPGPANTGVPAGTRLTNSGSLDLRKNGQIISGLNILGCVDVRAKNVIIRKSKITCSRKTWAVRTYDEAVNLVLEDVEINGRGINSTAVCCGNYTLRRVNIHNMIDGPRLGSNSTVVDSWIHDLVRVEDSHNDTLQTTGANDIVVRHNRLEPYRDGDPFNACLMIGSTTGPAVRNLLFEDNYCNGGNYSIGIRADLIAEDIMIRRNVFGRDFRFGVVARWGHPGITWEDSNVYADDHQPVVKR